MVSLHLVCKCRLVFSYSLGHNFISKFVIGILHDGIYFALQHANEFLQKQRHVAEISQSPGNV
jgi:hypothetical protein